MKPRSPELTELRRLLLNAEDEALLVIARSRKRILSQLTALSYDTNPNISTRAIKGTGVAAKIIAERDPEYIRNYLLRLFWLVNDESGGICWRAPELIGEILYHCPQFSQFFPLLISLLDLEKEDAPRFRTGTLWAIGRVAQGNKQAVQPALEQVQAFSSWDHDPETKEMSAWCVRQLTGARD